MLRLGRRRRVRGSGSAGTVCRRTPSLFLFLVFTQDLTLEGRSDVLERAPNLPCARDHDLFEIGLVQFSDGGACRPEQQAQPFSDVG